MPINLRAFKKESAINRKRFRSFITKLETSSHRGVLQEAQEANKEVWEEIDCLSCANCCKKMTPTLKTSDKIRIADHLGMTVRDFTNKYLEFDSTDRDWRMIKQPCVFLDLTTNKCNIYEVRPADCSGFPHLTKAPLKNYLYIHKQNIMYCPATYLFVEKMMNRIHFSNK
ncbi:MAG: YkgJ family cysteine cluster protein [Bacteroidota bacterium]